MPSCLERPGLPGLSSVLAQGSEEEESCTSEITTSLSEEVLDLRGADHYPKGAAGCAAVEGLRRGRKGICLPPRALGRQSLVVTGGLIALDANSRSDLRRGGRLSCELQNVPGVAPWVGLAQAWGLASRAVF